MKSRFLMLGDSAFTVEFPTLSGVEGARHVRALRSRIEDKITTGEITGVLDLVSASRSLTMVLDVFSADFDHVLETVKSLTDGTSDTEETAGRLWTLPVCYEGDYAPDLSEVAENAGMTTDDVIKIHSGTIYDVLLIGFQPGFPFLAEVDPKLRFPRRTSPRIKVPAGSVAIANNQTAIYPWESPGGWHLLGRCPVPLFDANRSTPALIGPGDRVKFTPVSTADYEKLLQDFDAGKLDATTYGEDA